MSAPPRVGRAAPMPAVPSRPPSGRAVRGPYGREAHPACRCPARSPGVRDSPSPSAATGPPGTGGGTCTEKALFPCGYGSETPHTGAPPGRRGRQNVHIVDGGFGCARQVRRFRRAAGGQVHREEAGMPVRPPVQRRLLLGMVRGSPTAAPWGPAAEDGRHLAHADFRARRQAAHANELGRTDPPTAPGKRSQRCQEGCRSRARRQSRLSGTSHRAAPRRQSHTR